METRGSAWARAPATGARFCALLALLSLATISLADNGDVIRASGALAGTPLADVTQDLRDGTFWVVGANGNSVDSHRIYHLGSDLSRLGFIENPHPPGRIPDVTTNRGIAFHSLRRTLFVLAFVRSPAGQFVVSETDPDSVDDAGFMGRSFALTPPGDVANLRGLAFDLNLRDFWTLDARNDTLIRFGLDGTIKQSFAIPGKPSPSTDLPGRGIAFDLEVTVQQAFPFLYTTFGDVFSSAPSKVVQLDAAATVDVDGVLFGVRTGVNVPLGAIPAGGLTGIHVARVGRQQRLVAVTSGGEVFQLEITVSNPVPPDDLRCSLTRTNEVSMSWTNHGAGAGGTYGGTIQVLRNGVPFATVPGDSVGFTDATPVQGQSTYSLRASAMPGGPLGAASCECSVVVGSGGVVDRVPLPGSSVHDVARNPETGEIFVTDPARGKIFLLDPDLAPIGEIASPWDDPGGIAFVPAIRLGFPPSDFSTLLAVTRTTGKQLRFIDTAGQQKTSITLSGISETNARIGGLTFIPGPRRFAAMELTSGQIFLLDANGSLVQACPPSFLLSDLEYDRGVAYDPLRETLLVTFVGGVVRELFAGGGCPPTDTEEFPPISLGGLGERFAELNSVGGIEIDLNTLLVTSPRSNSLARILVFPFENTFVRGDFNRNGAVDMVDAVATARYLFQQGPAPRCLDSADINDDGFLDIADPVYLVFYLFLGAAAPPPPFPLAGPDPTFRDNIGCAP